MPTDDERRAVARRLRSLDDSELQVYDMTYFAIQCAVGGGGDQYPDGRELADRLADLIEPPYPDATASYKGWRTEAYDPDGVLASPSNVAADLVRAHADGKMRHSTKEEQNEYSAMLEKMSVALHPVDRDALLEEAKELERCAWYFGLDFDEDEPLRDRLKEASEDFAGSARRIREALGVQDA